MIKPFIVTTDASNYAIAAISSSMNDEGKEKIIYFISRTLKGAEMDYFTTEKELIAVAWS